MISMRVRTAKVELSMEMAPFMQLLEVLQRGTDYLAARGIESPRLQVELILAHVLHVPRLQLYLEFNRDLGDAELTPTREAVRRRGQREPLQHVLGTTSFCGLELEVTPDTLIPRPETELLAERAWKWLAEHSESPTESPGVLDWGTGSGCLAIAVAVHAPEARFIALDRSAAALAVARRNALRHGCADRIRFIEGTGGEALPPDARFALILSNPPYIPSGELASLQPEVRDHEPRIALDGGPDGLEVIRHLATDLKERLRPAGCLMMEFGDAQGNAVTAILRDAGWTIWERHRDISGRERFVVARGEQ
jgi:release factor glutamine methyltransferase